MPDKLLWSWTLEDTKAALRKRGLPEWVERAVGYIGLGMLLYMAIIIGGGWLSYLLGVIVILGIYLSIKKKPPAKSYAKEAYLKVYNDGISVNLYGFYGFYKSDDILLDTLTVKNILHSNQFGIGFVKGLYFKTKNPNMTLKIPLVGLLSEKTVELEKVVIDLKRANNIFE